MPYRGWLGFAVLSFAIAVATARPGAQVPAGPPAVTEATSSAAVLKQYCTTCHNERLRSGGFVIDPADVTNVSAGADQWEKVVRKLRTQSMPPPGAPRPDAAGYNRVATFLETELARAEAARPHLGKLPLTHRLSRTEYRNAVRDLLALESLPREVSVDYLLPPDNISSGFDNLADLLFVSPSNKERYLDAARKISRLAVGDPAMPVMVNIHKLDPEHPQDERVDELPFGTRGGIAVRSEFPVDGTYIVRVDVGAAQGHDLANASHCDRSAAGAAILRWMRRPVSPIRQIPIPRLPRSIDRQCREEARGRSTQRVRLAQQVHAGDAPVAGVEALHPFHSNSRSR